MFSSLKSSGTLFGTLPLNIFVQVTFTRSQSTMHGCTHHAFFNASFVTSLVEAWSKIRYDAVSFESRFINRFNVNMTSAFF